MYIVDFFKRLVRKSNIPIIIYLVINVFIIGGFMMILFGSSGELPPWLAFLIGIGIYFLSLLLALSPFGEAILRMQTGCRPLKDPQIIQYIDPLFREVYARAKRLDSTIPDDVTLFVNDSPDPNAFATGRRTICITRGLMNMPPEQIKATLGHEFGHLAHKDTDLILLVTIGNFIVTIIITLIKIVVTILRVLIYIFSESLGALIATGLTLLFVDGLSWLWSLLGTALVMKSSRSNEYEADAFSFDLGYGESLIALLDTFESGGRKGLFASLASSHPDKEDRIARIEDLIYNDEPALGQDEIEELTFARLPYRDTDDDDYEERRAIDWDEEEESVPRAAFSGNGRQGRATGDTCPSCGTPLNGDDKFCQFCGEPVIKKAPPKVSKVFCGNCGKMYVEREAMFCGDCGTKLDWD